MRARIHWSPLERMVPTRRALCLLALGYLVGAERLQAQSAANSLAVLAATMDSVLAPAHMDHYAGTLPYSTHHPHGEPGTFCVVYSDPLSRPPVTERESRAAMHAAVGARMARWFELEPTAECTSEVHESLGLIGYEGEDGRSAIRVAIAVAFESPSVAHTHFGWTDQGLSMVGWHWRLERTEDGEWSVR